MAASAPERRHFRPKTDFVWIYDVVGGAGKTTLCRFLMSRYKSDTLLINVTPKMLREKLITVFFRERSRHPTYTGRCLVFDVPRSIRSLPDAWYKDFQAIRGGKMMVLAAFQPDLRKLGSREVDVIDLAEPGWLNLDDSSLPPEVVAEHRRIRSLYLPD